MTCWGTHLAGLDAAHAREILGRDAELAEILLFLDDPSDDPTTLLLEGQAGIGKTTLLDAGVQAALGRGYTVLACGPSQSEMRLSYAGLADLLDLVFDEAADGLPKVQRQALEAALLRAEPGDRAPEQRTVAAAVLGLLRAIAKTSPVLLAIDDLHWLDLPTARVLEFALRRLDIEPLLVLATLRTGHPDPIRLSEAMRPPALDRVHVGSMDLESISRLLAEHLDPSLPLETLKRIHEAGGGSPFFALEVGRALSEHNLRPEPGVPLPIPDDVAALLGERIAALPVPTRAALFVCAALARPTMAVVEAVHSSAADDLARAERAGIIRMDGDRVGFTHPLLASAAYGGIPEGQRREIHRLLTQAVTDPEERARHFALSTAGPDAEVAARVAEGARRAHGRGATVAAAELYELASRLTTDEPTRWRYLMAAGDHHHLAGDGVRAVAVLEEVAAHVPPGPVRAEALLHLSRVSWFVDDLARVKGRLEEATEEAGADPSTLSQIFAWLAATRLYREGPATAEPCVKVAVELAEESGDKAALAVVLSVAFDALGSLGPEYPQGLLDRALALEGSVDFFYVTDRPTYILANTIEPEGDGKRLLSLLLCEAQDRGDEPSTGLLQMNLGYAEWMTGNWERALTLLSEADQLRDRAGQKRRFRGIKALIEASLGDVEAARADAVGPSGEPGARDDGPDTPVYFHSGRWALGFLGLSEGDPAEAHRNLWPLWEAARRAGFGDPYWYPFAADEIEALVELDQLDQAGSMLDWLEERGREQDRPRTLASAGRCRGLLNAAEGDLERALVSIDKALELHRRIEAPFERGRTLLAQGVILRRVGRKRAARESLDEALATFDRLPAPLWAAKARAELARIGGRRAGPGALTEAEQRVASLAAAGRTNREIAETLFLSARTVESHLSHTYHKLGVRSRTELASALEAAHPHP